MDEIEFVFTRGEQQIEIGREPLELLYDPPTDFLTALPSGETLEGRYDETGHFMYFGQLRYCLRTPDGPIVGFEVVDLGSFEPEEFADALFGPRFVVPELSPERQFVGDLVYAAQERFGA